MVRIANIQRYAKLAPMKEPQQIAAPIQKKHHSRGSHAADRSRTRSLRPTAQAPSALTPYIKTAIIDQRILASHIKPFESVFKNRSSRAKNTKQPQEETVETGTFCEINQISSALTAQYTR